MMMRWIGSVVGAAIAVQSVALDDVVLRRNLQPADRTFAIVRRYKRIHGRTDADAQTLARIEIVDAAGGPPFRQDFPYSIDQRDFAETCDGDVETLDGSNGKGFVLDVGCLPSAPMSGGPWQVLGFIDGRIVPIGKPI